MTAPDEPVSATDPAGAPLRRGLAWALLLFVVVFAALVRSRLLDVPLERDEGEYAYAGQLILQGVAPYDEAYNMKLPGVYVAYAAILGVFGQTSKGVHIGLLLVNAASIVLVFLLARRLLGELAGVAAAASFAALSLGETVQGLFANAEHFVVLFALAGLVLLLRAFETEQRRTLALSGLCLGTSFLMKQHAVAYLLLAGLLLLGDELPRRPLDRGRLAMRVGLLTGATVAPFALTCVVLWIAGVFGTFWFWTFTYARAYTGQVSLGDAFERFEHYAAYVVGGAPYLWWAAAAGLTAVVWDRGVRRRWAFLGPFVLLSLLAICPGFLFRPHYFLLTLPAAALLVGAAARASASLAARAGKRGVPLGVSLGWVGACLVLTLFGQGDYLFRQSPSEVSRSTFGLNPFAESLEIARIVAAHTEEGDRIAVIGSEPQIYFYTGRRSATGYIYTYALLEDQPYAKEMQEEMIREIEAGRPEALVYVRVKSSWIGPSSLTGAANRVDEWFRRYQRDFRLVRLALITEEGTRFYGPQELASAGTDLQSSVWIYARK